MIEFIPGMVAEQGPEYLRKWIGENITNTDDEIKKAIY
jgi:hypothetical protein